MAEQVEDVLETGDEGADRERSTIVFPYNDLDNATRIAVGVHTVGGTSCEWEQLAAQLNVAAKGGGFRLMAIAAKVFGLVTYGQGKVSLTPLGQRIVDSEQAAAAKVDAFLNVPLYVKIYEKYKGSTLPPDSALENEMANLGVAKNQTAKARQTFQRSARQAGFFAHGPSRLVKPATGPTRDTPKPQDGDEDKARKNGGAGGAGGDDTLHPFIAGLLKTLPPAETEWKAEGRRKWLQTAANVFALIYTDDSEPTKELVVSFKEDSAK